MLLASERFSIKTGDLVPGRRVVGLFTSFTADPIAQALKDAGYEVRVADFNQMHTTALDPSGAFGGPVDRTVALWRLEDVFSQRLNDWRAGEGRPLAELKSDISELIGLLSSVPARSGTPILIGVPPQPLGNGIDPLDPASSLPIADLLADVRRELVDAVSRQAGARLIDHGRLVDVIGTERAHDARNQMLYRQPYTTSCNRLLADSVDRALRAFDRPVPKAIVLDADNTLWAGIVGEDGVSGVALAGTFPGAAFEQFHHALRTLRAQGVLLGIASKNEPGAVREVFDQRSDMVLQASDIAAWRVGWGAKSQSIREIADEFNIGLDSVVFVDDSPFEIAEVEGQLPEVRCLMVPEDIEDLPDLIAATGLFRSIQATAEDRDRTEMIQTEGKRRSMAATLSHEEFLASLDLQVVLHRDDPLTLERVAQLTNKTNQFNLTTIRRSEAEIADLLASADHTVYAASVSDRFGDYGLVGVAITERHGNVMSIDSLLMSCRVLKRGIETSTLR